jgi:hypothetical protein
MKVVTGECDCCGKWAQLSQVWPCYVGETWACDECTGWADDNDEELRFQTETGEQPK